MSDFTDPGDRMAQAVRVREFLTRLATDDALLLRYVKDPVGLLREELDAGRLTLEDFAVLVEGNCCRVSELLAESGVVWVRWLGGG